MDCQLTVNVTRNFRVYWLFNELVINHHTFMKLHFSPKTMLALAVALVAATGSLCLAQDQPMPPAASGSGLPPEIAPNTPLAQVVQLVQSGVSVEVIQNYVANSPGAFDLDADKISDLTDLGVPKEVINAMLARDKALYAAANLPPPTVAPPAAPDDSTAPPTEAVTVDYFDNTLAPYGTWVAVDGYGRCWRPTVVNYDAGWRPYCDRGTWVNTDCGWYWNSDYSWGITFHYGRWFRDARFGWCWYPDTEWAPSWVTWRSSSDYCGWAPLPPLAVFRPGVGFFYRGVAVAVDFDFGLGADYFTFVTPDRFCEHHPRRYAVDAVHVRDVFTRTAVINHFDSHDRVFVNAGIPVDRVRTHDNRPIQVVRVASLPNASREGWRGAVDSHPARPVAPGNNNPARNYGNGNNQVNHEPVVRENGNNDANRRPNTGVGGQPPVENRQTGSPYVAPRPQPQENQINRNPEPGNYSRPVIETPPQRPELQRPEQTQPEPRIEKPVETERPAPPVEQRAEPPVEQHETHAGPAPHNEPAAAPAENQPHDAGKDKNNH
jgi:hypothetical protein